MNNARKYPVAEVYLNIKNYSLDHPLDYSIPENLNCRIIPGYLAKVPFRDKQVIAFIARIKSSSLIPDSELKDIIGLVGKKPLLDSHRMRLLYWLSFYYIQPLSRVYRLFLPPVNIGDKVEKLLEDPIRHLRRKNIVYIDKDRYLKEKDKINWKRNKAQKRLMEQVLKYGRTEKSYLLRNSKTSSTTLSSLVKKGIIKIDEKSIRSDQSYLVDKSFFLDKGIRMNEQQKKVLDTIIGSIKVNRYHNYILEGVTGSGKTLIYLEIAKYLKSINKRLLILVPEISQTPQLFSRFYDEFGPKAAFYHSNMAERERLDIWLGNWLGEFEIVIGTRSAIFLPVNNLGCIIMDEGHDVSYKESSSIRYSSFSVISRLAKILKIPVLYGSATPSLEVIHDTKTLDSFTRLKLPNKASPAKLFKKIIDLKKISEKEENSIISRHLHKELHGTLSSGDKAIIFINRRGYSNFLICKDCGYIPKCKNCNLSFTYHSARKDNLLCHHCNQSLTFDGRCEKCGSRRVSFCGTGIQKVEEALIKRFPDYPVYRMDSDSTSKRGSQSNILKNFAKKGPAILIGTQMVAKGLDLEDVTLVGIINCESMLELPDYHMYERVFQNVTQVAGRAARKFKNGKVLLQTYNPENKVIRHFIDDDAEGFYEAELRDRKELGYPPYSKLLNIIISGMDEKKVKDISKDLFTEINKITKIDFEVLGPAPAPFAKVQRHHRWHIIIKTKNIYRFNGYMSKVLKKYNKTRSVKIIVDVDPVWVL